MARHVALAILPAVLLSACAMAPLPTSQPVQAAASKPSETVTLSRAEFDELAAMVIEKNLQKNLALSECHEETKERTADVNACGAELEAAKSKTRLSMALGIVGAFVAAAIGGIVGYAIH